MVLLSNLPEKSGHFDWSILHSLYSIEAIYKTWPYVLPQKNLPFVGNNIPYIVVEKTLAK